MTLTLTILASALLLLAVYIVVMNWMCVILSTRNKSRGIDRHSSMVPLMSLIGTIGAYATFPDSKAEWMFVVPLLDLSNWSLLWLPFYLLRESFRKKTTEPQGGDDDAEPSS